MNLGAPAFAWAAMALLPLVAVYFIKTRPRRQTVNAFFLWQKVFQQKAASSLFQKLRNLLSLLLVALAFAAAVMALMKPQLGSEETPDLLIVVDRSVSMRGGGGKSRMELAKARVEGWIAALGGSQRAALATADTKLEYQVHLTGNARPLRDALDRIDASDLPLGGGVLDELALLSSVAGDGESKVRILFVTDGRSSLGELPPGIERVLVGENGENAGITAADLRWSGPGEARLFISVLSGFAKNREVDFELVEADGERVLRLFTMNLIAGEETRDSIQVERMDPGSWLLRMNVDDDLDADNQAALGLNAPQPVPVQVQSPNPFFFQQVVAAFARADSLFEPIEEFAQLGLAEGTAPDTEVAVIFAPQGESPFWSKVGEELSLGAPEVVEEDHPLIARVDPALLNFEGARKLEAPVGSVVVLRHANGTPLLYTSSVDGRKAVVVNMSPSMGDFFLSPWFPVLIHDATALLLGREDSFPSAVATGDRVIVPGTEEVTKTIRLSEGEEEELVAVSPIEVKRVGSYALTRSFTTWWLGGAVLSPGESGAVIGEAQSVVMEPASGWPLAVWLLLAALLAVVAEEILYHRRKVG